MDDPSKPVPKNSKVCIICHQEATGSAVKIKEDIVIQTIRKIKRRLGVAQNNELCVCTKDLEMYQKKRKQFEKEIFVIVGIAVFIFIILSGLPLLSGRFEVGIFVSSLIVAIIIVVLGTMFKYVPGTENEMKKASPLPVTVESSKKPKRKVTM